MTPNPRTRLPSVSRLLAEESVKRLVNRYGRTPVREALRDAVETHRLTLESASGSCTRDELERSILRELDRRLRALDQLAVRPVINGTGILLHTGLGRAPLPESARAALLEAAGACQVESDPDTGERIYRGFQVAHQLQTLTGAADSLIVNNNAGATLLVLQALCHGRDVLISRGQLVEIGGAFRLPEIFRTAGVRLKEVGTTNRTHLRDYEDAVDDNTAAILRVHASNYRIAGFATAPTTAELSRITQNRNLILLDDIGSGQPAPCAALERFQEPTFRGSVQAGADVTLGSGDKLLGGPQCGIIAGRRHLITVMQEHPLARCLRVDKLTLAALHATLRIHLCERFDELPLIQMLQQSVSDLNQRATDILRRLRPRRVPVEICSVQSEVGGGTCADRPVESVAIRLTTPEVSTETLARALRLGTPSVWGRVKDDALLLDLRSIAPGDDDALVAGIASALEDLRPSDAIPE